MAFFNLLQLLQWPHVLMTRLLKCKCLLLTELQHKVHSVLYLFFFIINGFFKSCTVNILLYEKNVDTYCFLRLHVAPGGAAQPSNNQLQLQETRAQERQFKNAAQRHKGPTF